MDSIISKYDRYFFDGNEDFTYIGNGKLGGKAQGLKDIKQCISQYQCENIIINIPRLTVITTSHFEAFMDDNELWEIALSHISNERLLHYFQKASLPIQLVGDLRVLISKVHTPLAIRSSSLLEDSLESPFAGVYATKMVPNNQIDTDTRFQKLVEAIKFVYASTYFQKAKDYAAALGQSIQDERMAVIIQEVVGKRYENSFYPNISGVARSYNFYPTGHAKMEDGVVNLALGLGKTIVDGGKSWSYSPKYPKAYPPYNSPDDLIKQTQREFWSVNMGEAKYQPFKETEYLKQDTLSVAEEHGVMAKLSSTYDVSADRLQMGIAAYGPRILTFAPLLHTTNLNQCIKEVLDLCEETTGAKIEMEFAITFGKDEPVRLGVLQVRPMNELENSVEFDESELQHENILLACDNVLGNGVFENIYDIVFVKPDMFNFAHSSIIALDIEACNTLFIKEQRPYILIGFGRWGSSDPWLGIPVNWSQISAAQVIVESSLENVYVEMSQGTHFFHNLSNLKRLYFSIKDSEAFPIDWNWLNKQTCISETKYIKHVRTLESLKIKSSSIKRLGGIFYESV